MKFCELKEYSKKYSEEELIKYNYDIAPLNELALKEGARLASIYHADEDVVLIALSLMDSKLPEAVRLNSPKKHVEMSIEACKDIFLNVEDLDETKKKNILKCIEEHHGVEKEFYSIESEVVANADCYKFLSPKGIMIYASILGRRLNDFEEEWNQLEKKMDEKIKNLTLDITKEELIDCYSNFKRYIAECRKQ